MRELSGVGEIVIVGVMVGVLVGAFVCVGVHAGGRSAAVALEVGDETITGCSVVLSG